MDFFIISFTRAPVPLYIKFNKKFYRNVIERKFKINERLMENKRKQRYKKYFLTLITYSVKGFRPF